MIYETEGGWVKNEAGGCSSLRAIFLPDALNFETMGGIRQPR